MSAHLIIDGRAASLSEKAYADFHGKSIFTTLRTRQREILLWQRHWQRLSEHARFFGYELPDEKLVLNLFNENLTKEDQKLRIIVADRRYALTIEPYIHPPSHIYEGVSVMTSSWQVHPQLARFKTANYLPYAYALREAEAANAFEALLPDGNGFIVDGSRTSLMHFDGTTLTSLLGGLEGCMREEVLAFAQKKGISVDKRYFCFRDITHQLLLTSSLLGVVPVNQIQFTKVSELVDAFRLDS
jgi:branched-subunit amino acid aminotransferase/4-amino-4-deoxychorismate lyase